MSCPHFPLDIKIFIDVFQKYWLPILCQNLFKNGRDRRAPAPTEFAIKEGIGTSLVLWCLRLCTPHAGPQARTLVRELRPHVLHAVAPKDIR